MSINYIIIVKNFVRPLWIARNVIVINLNVSDVNYFELIVILLLLT